MKKLKLNLQNIEGVELLTKAQLNNVLGGTDLGDTTTTTTSGYCNGTSDVYCCEGGSAVGSLGNCVDLHNQGCTSYATDASECPNL